MNENYLYEARIVDTTTGETIIKVSAYTLESLEEELCRFQQFETEGEKIA